MFLRIIILVVLHFPVTLLGAEDNEPVGEEFRVLLETQVKGNSVAVLVREGGHLLGQPYQIELRAQCNKNVSDKNQWSIVDSFSVCDLSPESLKINTQKSAIAMKTKMADLLDFDRQIEQGHRHPIAQCSKESSIKKFSLRKVCTEKQ